MPDETRDAQEPTVQAEPTQPAAPANQPDTLAQTIEALLASVQAERARRDKVPVGSYRCDLCQEVHQWDGPSCGPDDTDPTTFQERELRKELRRMLENAYKTIPEGLEWCRIKDPKWTAKCADEGRTFAKQWNREMGHAVLFGPTGAGKTISAVALMHRILDAARDLPAEKVPTKKLRWAAGIAFVSGPTLALARRQHTLGEEAPLVDVAKRASLLVLDEIGYEWFNPDQDTTLFEVLDHRYLRHTPTIITTELDREKLKRRYRPAIERRMAEIGLYIELKKREK